MIPNPRDRKHGDPLWMLRLVRLMHYVNAGMITVLLVSLWLLVVLQ